jgi:hypothetical protein
MMMMMMIDDDERVLGQVSFIHSFIHDEESPSA